VYVRVRACVGVCVCACGCACACARMCVCARARACVENAETLMLKAAVVYGYRWVITYCRQICLNVLLTVTGVDSNLLCNVREKISVMDKPTTVLLARDLDQTVL
jgi:hypothetical protein